MKHPGKQVGPEAEYQALMQAGELKPDLNQAKAVASLERLYCALIDYPEIRSHRNGFTFRNWWPVRFFHGPEEIIVSSRNLSL